LDLGIFRTYRGRATFDYWWTYRAAKITSRIEIEY